MKTTVYEKNVGVKQLAKAIVKLATSTKEDLTTVDFALLLQSSETRARYIIKRLHELDIVEIVSERPRKYRLIK